MGSGSSGIGGAGGGSGGKASAKKALPTQAEYAADVNKQVSALKTGAERTGVSGLRPQMVTAIDSRGNEREAQLNITPIYDRLDRSKVVGYNYTAIYENKGVNPGTYFRQTFLTLSMAKAFIKDMFEVD